MTTSTVRPRGHPFDRRLKLSWALQARMRAERDAWFLVVDEGPGLSGASLVTVAEKLGPRVVLFPSHDPDPGGFVSVKDRALWPAYPKFIEPFRPEEHVPSGARDLSGGKWRGIVRSNAPVYPMHERRKYLYQGVLWKWAGLGFYGAARPERTQIVFDGVSVRNGWA